MSSTSSVKFDDAEVVREFAVSKDGTRVPVNIIRRKGTPSWTARIPRCSMATAATTSAMTPELSRRLRAYLAGPGRRVRRSPTCAAAANTAKNGTTPESSLTSRTSSTISSPAPSTSFSAITPRRAHLAIVGGSNGGLLMGAVLTQRPDLFRAVVSYVGIYDMLRAELDPNGAFNITEYGTVKDPDQFKALYAYSPYHHVDDGANYPAVLFSDRGKRSPGEPHELAQDDRAAAGGEWLRPSHPAAHFLQCRTRHRHRPG